MNRLRIIAFSTAGVAVLLNLLCEHVLLDLRPAEGVLIPGLLDLHYAWNRGVSFGLFTQDTATGSYILSAILALLSAVVAVFAWRARDNLSAYGYGLILGGALGNLADRPIYGAVFDFLAVHLGSLSLFVCNLSDIYISAGVLLLLVEELRGLKRQ